MNTCGTCKYFGDPVRDGNQHVPTGYHVCAWIKQWDDYGPPPDASAVVVDGSGYFAALCVVEDFGCNKWAAKDSGEDGR